MITLNKQQEEGLLIAVDRFKHNMPWTCIAGFAGTGKSTLVSYIISALNIDPTEVTYIAYTGKAALVLQQKGCLTATTAHKFLYNFRKVGPNRFIQIPKTTDEIFETEGYKQLIVVDEVSMLPGDMWHLLLAHGIPVIALGDPGQLPPIYETNGVLDKPHIFLNEIMRQEKDNEIIDISMRIREGKHLQLFNGNNVKIIDKKDLVPGMLLWADQIICAKNETRKYINNVCRRLLYGFTPDTPLQKEDKIICLRNNWEVCSNMGYSLINGTIGYVKEVIPAYSHPIEGTVFCNLEGEVGDYFSALLANTNYDEETMVVPRKTAIPNPIDYGYAITCWKAQGSQWNKVLLFEEDFPFDKEEHKKYLYTGITRAIDKVVIVRK